MKVEEGKYSIAELVDWYRRRDLVVNTEYQRGGGLWPPSAKSYFIDSILKEFPFPKVYFHERVDRETKRPHREIVDGQQRIRTIVDFVDGKFALGKNARGVEGMRFSELSEDQQDSFYSYTVSVDVIRNADRSEILQMFRRMNAFTLPLNAAEKRHSEFFGEFKDWVNTVLDQYGSILIDWNVLTSRQVVRMADAEFISDLALAMEEGIVSTSPARLRDLYKKYDQTFPVRSSLNDTVTEVFNVVLSDLSSLQRTHITKAHVFHSLLCALTHNRFGLKDAQEATGLAPINEYYVDQDRALTSLRRLAAAHEEKDTAEFGEYVKAASEGGNRAPQRVVRIKWLCRPFVGSSPSFMALHAAWQQFEGEVKLLSGHFRNFAASKPLTLPSHFTVLDECLLEGLLSRVWQAWNSFCRTCVIESCVGTVDAAGRAVPGLLQATSEAHVSGAAIHAKKTTKPPHWGTPNTLLRAEPTWGDMTVLVNVITRLRPVNTPRLLGAFSSGHASARALQVIRNGAAHNHSQNVSEILLLRSAYVAFQIAHPTHALFWTEPHSSDFLVTRAIDDLTYISYTAIS